MARLKLLVAKFFHILSAVLSWKFVVVVLIKAHCVTMDAECVLEHGDSYAVAFARVSNWAREQGIKNCSSKKRCLTLILKFRVRCFIHYEADE